MAAPALDGLPTETLNLIAQFVGEHPPSLGSFALVNRSCHTAVSTSRFRNIQVTIVNQGQLRRDVDKCLDMLEHSHSLGHVRWLEVKGTTSPLSGGYRQKLQDEHWAFNDGHLDRIDEILCEEEDAMPVSNSRSALDQKPLVDLLQAIPHLQDLVFNSYNQFSPSLFAALKQYHPNCRLHLPRLHFESLVYAAIDSHEMAVATWPLLHTIGLRWVEQSSDGTDTYSQEAAMRLIGGLAPNLKRVKIMHCVPSSQPAPISRKPWEGFHSSIGKSLGNPVPAALESLILPGIVTITAKVLQNLQNHISFASLRYLNLDSGVNADALRWASFNASFPNLVELDMKLVPRYLALSDPDPELGLCAVLFLDSLPLLEILRLSGTIGSDMFSSAVRRHGKALKKLSVKSPKLIPYANRLRCLNKDEILQIQQSCPLLEELSVPVKRRQGTGPEVELYQILGQMEQLTTIFLTLVCSDRPAITHGRTPGNHLSDEFMLYWYDSTAGIRNQQVYDVLLNSAVDETLARSIWDCISASKVGRPLLSLKIRTIGDTFGDMLGPLDRLLMHIGRSFLLQRSVRDDHESVSAVELCRRARVNSDQLVKHILKQSLVSPAWEDQYPDNPPPGSVYDIFRRIWPPKEGSSSWRDDWASLPLQR